MTSTERAYEVAAIELRDVVRDPFPENPLERAERVFEIIKRVIGAAIASGDLHPADYCPNTVVAEGNGFMRLGESILRLKESTE